MFMGWRHRCEWAESYDAAEELSVGFTPSFFTWFGKPRTMVRVHIVLYVMLAVLLAGCAAPGYIKKDGR